MTLHEMAVRLGAALGIDDELVMDGLFNGICFESALSLHNLGLVVDVEAALEKHSTRLGVLPRELTQIQRYNACRIVVFAAAEAKIKALA